MKVGGYTFGAVLGLVALIPLFFATGYVVGDREPAPAPQPKWIYAPQQRYATPQLGVVVLCQVKTNSRPFANRVRAKAGDMLVQTCRAVRADSLEPVPPA